MRSFTSIFTPDLTCMNAFFTCLARLAGIGCLSLALVGCGPQEVPNLQGKTMGTTWSLQAVGADEALRVLIQTHLDQREAVFSHWKADSPLSRFNASTSTNWVPVPLELVRIIEVAHEVARETEGALDVTLGPQVEAWGFGGKPEQADKPGLEHVGWRHLAWREAPPALKKDAPEVRLNVAAVAEGFLLDELVARLRAEGLQNFLLELGGEVFASGHAPDGGPWRVGLQSPDGIPGNTLERLPLTDACISTSGSYRHRYEKEGHTYSHIIDPRTGRPITHRLVSVTVIHPRAVLADGYATALMVLGPEKGREVAQRLGLRVIWLEESSDSPSGP